MPKTTEKPFPFNKTELLAILDFIGGDGHTIFDWKGMALHTNIAPERLAPYVKDHASAPASGKFADHKQTIYAPGSAGVPGVSPVIEHLVGLYGLDMLKSLYNQTKQDWTDAPTGRGFLARHLTRQLRVYAQTMKE